MAKSQFEYVKEFETSDNIMPDTWIVVRLDGKCFREFSRIDNLKKPNDIRCLNLMNKAASNAMNEIHDIILSYGANDKYSFVFQRKTKLYNRRRSKILTHVCSLFTVSFAKYWGDYFPGTPLAKLPSFDGSIVCFPTNTNILNYLSNQQSLLMSKNVHNYSKERLVLKSELLQQKIEQENSINEDVDFGKIENAISQLDINVSEQLKNGSLIVRKKINKKELVVEKSENIDVGLSLSFIDIMCDTFWKTNPHIFGLPNGGRTDKLKDFDVLDSIIPDVWIVVRLDGKCFHKFADTHHFKKPNDIRGLNLMNKAASSVMNDIPDIILAYGESDEYSFVFKRDTELYDRRLSKILTHVCSLFSASFVLQWKDFFPDSVMLLLPSFDGRIVCYPTNKTLRDYLSWRQADCHINNLYNTTFWTLVQEGGLSRKEAEDKVKRTVSSEKNEILFSEFGINYNEEPEQFKKGSLIFRKMINEKEVIVKDFENIDSGLGLLCSDIIRDKFWKTNPHILENE